MNHLDLLLTPGRQLLDVQVTAVPVAAVADLVALHFSEVIELISVAPR